MSASRTKGRLDCDTGYGDGHIFLSAADAQLIGAGTGTMTRNGAGDFSLNVGVSQTVTMLFALSSLLFRYGLQDDFQEQFGSSAAGGSQGFPVGGYTTLTTASGAVGGPVNLAVLNSASFTIGRKVLLGGTQKTFITAIPDATHITVAAITATIASGSVVTENLFTTPADVTGPPPYTGLTQFTPVTAPRPKGILIRQIYPVYQFGVVNATTNTIGLTKTVFANATAPIVSNLLTNAANGLGVTFGATPNVTPIQIPTPAYQITKYASYNIEWDIVTAATGTARIYGIFVDVGYNWN